VADPPEGCLNIEETIECPCCQGVGEHSWIAEGSSVRDTKVWPCTTCEGTGELQIKTGR